VQGDPTEGALLCAAHKAGIEGGSGPHGDRLDAIPFDSQHQYMATLDAGGTVFVKGAVEVLLARCTNALDASGAVVMLDHERVRREMEEMATAGLRVLAFAHRTLPAASRLRHDDIAGLTFLGLQGMIDPPRPEAIAAVRACHRAGISVKMITGDHALTAAAIARQLGIGKTDEKGFPRALSGAEIARLSDEEVVGLAEEMDVFARVAPEQKLRLVDALQARGHVVAMTGDGVNDGPALKQADIGVAMGITGTEVAKEAADMVLTDDNFASIEAAVEEGRGVFDNLTKFIAWTLPTNAGEALVLLAAIVAGVTLPILPIQLLWINLTTAALLGTTLAFEPKEPDIMGRPPRSPRMPLLTGALTWRILLVSVIILVGAFGLFEYELQRGASVAEARTVAVNVVVLVQILYLWNARSLTRSPLRIGLLSNPWVIGGTVMMALVQLLFTHAPFMNRLFSAAPLPRALWLDALAVGLASFAIVEVEKWLRRRLSPRSPGEGERDPR
jgi:Ca2+-transporting ATPase